MASDTYGEISVTNKTMKLPMSMHSPAYGAGSRRMDPRINEIKAAVRCFPALRRGLTISNSIAVETKHTKTLANVVSASASSLRTGKGAIKAASFTV